MIKAIIFDMDGVVIDSEGIWEEVDNEFLKEFGVNKTLSKEIKLKYMGRGSLKATEIIQEAYGIKGDTRELTEKRRLLALKLYNERLELKPNVGKFLDDLKKTDYKVGLATSASGELLEIVKDNVDFDEWFSVMVTIDDVEKGKPAPDIYLLAAKMLGIAPEECLVFEDAPSGVRAAKAAGMRCVGVVDKRWENHSISELADKVIYDFGEMGIEKIEELKV